jgi:hypothetical protein
VESSERAAHGRYFSGGAEVVVDPIKPGEWWICACVKRNRKGDMTHIRNNSFEVLACRSCGTKRPPVEESK